MDLSPVDAPIDSVEELEQYFRTAEKPPTEFRIGAEAEKFGLLSGDLAPLPYSGARSIGALFERLVAAEGWQPLREGSGVSGPTIALRRGESAITLEPGGQFELSGAPWRDVHAVASEVESHFAELLRIGADLRLRWLSLGFHPTATQDSMPQVPKERYGIMRHYLPTQGPRGLDMMYRTSTVQANFDYESEEDALRKLRVLVTLSPVFQALCACSPFYEGKVSDLLSQRLDVWLKMDPRRSGLIPQLWRSERPRYRDYIEWALDAGMFYIKRGGQVVRNTGQSFRDFLQSGFQGHRATLADWTWHLGTLFPEVRLKRTLEVRSCDAMPRPLLPAMPALITGLIYDETSLAAAEDLVRSVRPADVAHVRSHVPGQGLRASFAERPLRDWALEVLAVSRAGLERRGIRNAVGETEAVWLRPLEQLAHAGKTPAEVLLQGSRPGAVVTESHLRACDAAEPGAFTTLL